MKHERRIPDEPDEEHMNSWREIEEAAYRRERREINEARRQGGDLSSYSPFATRGD